MLQQANNLNTIMIHLDCGQVHIVALLKTSNFTLKYDAIHRANALPEVNTKHKKNSRIYFE